MTIFPPDLPKPKFGVEFLPVQILNRPLSQKERSFGISPDPSAAWRSVSDSDRFIPGWNSRRGRGKPPECLAGFLPFIDSIRELGFAALEIRMAS
jgi:hypothetical protein